MRRKDKEILDRGEIDRILDETVVLHIALVDGDSPYLIPVNFGYKGGSIYIHTAPEGRKIDLIRKNNQVAFQAEAGIEIVQKSIPHKCSMLYRSVAGTGRAFFVETRKEKKLALELLMDHYHGNGPDGWEFGECLDAVFIVRIDIDSISGKESLPRHMD